MGLIVPVAHDFTCSWCWIGMHQARRLRRDFGVKIEWRAFELYPEGIDLPGEPVSAPRIENRPETPRRIELALAAEGLESPLEVKDYGCRTNLAHRAVEHAKSLGVQDELVERLYMAYWKEGADLSDLSVLCSLASELVPDLEEALSGGAYQHKIVPFNKPAYAAGVFNVPTFWIGGERFAEQPFSVLAKAIGGTPSEAPYVTLDFPAPPANRPYVLCNMVATIDGKTTSGSRDETVMDLGSKLDHASMRNIESAAEAVMIGAQTLRATPKVHFDPRLIRIVVTQSGRLPLDSRFIADAPRRAIVACRCSVELDVPEGVRAWMFDSMAGLLERLRAEVGIGRLLVEGGSELNASLLAEDLVDELFLTIAPKVKLGSGVPTYAGGEPLPRGELLGFELVSEQALGDEVFLRYRRKRA